MLCGVGAEPPGGGEAATPLGSDGAACIAVCEGVAAAALSCCSSHFCCEETGGGVPPRRCAVQRGGEERTVSDILASTDGDARSGLSALPTVASAVTLLVLASDRTFDIHEGLGLWMGGAAVDSVWMKVTRRVGSLLPLSWSELKPPFRKQLIVLVAVLAALGVAEDALVVLGGPPSFRRLLLPDGPSTETVDPPALSALSALPALRPERRDVSPRSSTSYDSSTGPASPMLNVGAQGRVARRASLCGGCG